jgi:hypothetical protein
MGGATRDRHLGADDIYRRFPSRSLGRSLGGGGKPSGAFGHDLVIERWGISATRHAGIEMDLGKTGGDVVGDHCSGAAQRHRGRKVLPWIGTEMVAPENEPSRIEPDFAGDRFDEADEVGGPHAGIAALLVDLVTGRLDEYAPVGAKR